MIDLNKSIRALRISKKINHLIVMKEKAIRIMTMNMIEAQVLMITSLKMMKIKWKILT